MYFLVTNIASIVALIIILPIAALKISAANKAYFRISVRQLHQQCIYLCIAKGWSSPHRLSRAAGCKLATARLVLEHFRDIGVLELRFDGRYYLTPHGEQFAEFLITQQYDPAKRLERQAQRK